MASFSWQHVCIRLNGNLLNLFWLSCRSINNFRKLFCRRFCFLTWFLQIEHHSRLSFEVFVAVFFFEFFLFGSLKHPFGSFFEFFCSVVGNVFLVLATPFWSFCANFAFLLCAYVSISRAKNLGYRKINCAFIFVLTKGFFFFFQPVLANSRKARRWSIVVYILKPFRS